MMKKYFPFLFILLLFILIFKEWFGLSLISAGDFSSFSSSNLENIQIFPYAWGFNLAVGGLGSFISPFSWLHFIITIPLIFAKLFSLNWVVTERLFYLYPLLAALLIIPSFVLKKFFPKVKFSFIATLIFSLNTYVLMLIGGGQIFIALSYALSPLVFYLFVNSFLQKKLFPSLCAGLLFSLETMLDLRIAYVVVFAFLFYLLINVSISKKFITGVLYGLVIPILTALFIHSYWLIPTLILHKNPLSQLGQIYTSQEAVKFFSFARLENTISLLHPNWPENLFGKVYFMKPEFLFIPILAYISVFFLKRQETKTKKTLIFFASLGLLGAFLAKGANDPLGFIYVWMFDHIPGFIMFRDPTKWYLLVAFSYSILIPFSIWKIYEWIRMKSKFSIKFKIFNFQNLFLILVVLYSILLVRPAILGKLEGTFKPTYIPSEYILLEKYLSSDRKFYRTLWVPTVQRYAFYNVTHPPIVAWDLFKTTDYSSLFRKMAASQSEELFQKLSVKYVIVPYDSKGEIFLKDRKYNDKLYMKTINALRKISWLKEVKGFGKIAVFEVPNPKDHFWTTSSQLVLEYKYLSPVDYNIKVNNAKKGDLIVFSESYDKEWMVNGLSNTKYDGLFNSFVLRKDGNYALDLYYYSQFFTNIGIMISGFSLVLILGYLLASRIRK